MTFVAPDPTLQALAPRPGPRSKTDLFVSFSWLALQGFGGVLAIVQRELVEKKQWMTLEEFVDDWAVAQILPGPNVVNLSLMIGDRYFGMRGALAALAGMLALPLVIVLLLVVLPAELRNCQQPKGLCGVWAGAVAAGLIAATGHQTHRGIETQRHGADCLLGVRHFGFVVYWLLALASDLGVTVSGCPGVLVGLSAARA